jgi:hypothetical protein
LVAAVLTLWGSASVALADEPAVASRPPPYSVAWQLRSPSAGNVVRSDTAVAMFETAEGSGLTIASTMSLSYKVTPTVAPLVRFAISHNDPAVGETGQALSNPLIGAIWSPPLLAAPMKVAFFGGFTLPIGGGGGNDGDPATLAANRAAVAARSSMDNALFAINDAAFTTGVDLAYIQHGLTVQVEATVLQAIQVRGDDIQPDKTKTNFTSGVHAGYFLADVVSLGAEVRYQRYLSTPRFVEAAPAARDTLSVAAGIRAHLDLGEKRWLRPGIAYARGLDDPMDGSGYSVVQVDVPFAF